MEGAWGRRRAYERRTAGGGGWFRLGDPDSPVSRVDQLVDGVRHESERDHDERPPPPVSHHIQRLADPYGPPRVAVLRRSCQQHPDQPEDDSPSGDAEAAERYDPVGGARRQRRETELAAELGL